MNSEPLIAQQLLADPRIGQAIELLRSALADHSDKLHAGGPRNELSGPYQKWLDRFASLRGNSLFFPYLGSGAGHGAWSSLLMEA